MKQLKETLQSACTERDNIESERALDAELERMQTIISSLTEERDQLQEILQVLREEKNHLKKEMEEKDELVRENLYKLWCILWVHDVEPFLSQAIMFISNMTRIKLFFFSRFNFQILRVQSDLNKEQFSDSSCVTSEENPVQLQQVLLASLV